MIGHTAEIRPFRAEDAEAIQQIAADTAFFGEPVEAFMEDRRLFIDSFVRFYMDCLPDYVFVAELDRKLIGYICGSPHPSTGWMCHYRRIYGPLVLNLIKGRYRIGPLTRGYVMRGMRSILKGSSPTASTREYPAHLHINLLSGYRGGGVGRKLMDAFISKMRAESVIGIQLHTTAENQAACHLYEAMGFSMVKSASTDLWGPLLHRPVEARCYGLRLI